MTIHDDTQQTPLQGYHYWNGVDWDPAKFTARLPKRRRWVLPLVAFGTFVLGIGVGGAVSGSTAVESTTLNTPSQTAPASPPASSSATPSAKPSVIAPKPQPSVESPKPAEASGTVSQENALRSAKSYLEMSGFSRNGLIEQLSSEYGDNYSVADATWAVDHLHANWKREAVEAGKAYLELGGFSRAGLIEQLSSPSGDQFTKSQATYAANQLGL